MFKKFNFKFNNDRKETSYYVIQVTVQDENNYYDIKYEYQFFKNEIDNLKTEKHLKCVMHPFYLRGGLTQYNFSENRSNVDGVVVYKNNITTSMIEHLSMQDNELKNHIGRFSTQKYRQNLMISLCYL